MEGKLVDSGVSMCATATDGAVDCDRRVERKPRIPVLTCIGHAILYVFWLIPMLGWGTAVAFFWPMCLLIGCTIGSNVGDSKIRLLLTSLVGAMLFLVLIVSPIVCGCLLLVFALPFGLIWLPCSNRWYQELEKWRNKTSRRIGMRG